VSRYDYQLTDVSSKSVGAELTQIVEISNIFSDPKAVIEDACSKHFAQINPHYPGVRATVEPELLSTLCACVSELAATMLSQGRRNWVGQAWYSIVTQPAQALTPIQRLPHFDGFDQDQLAVMIYLNQTKHGGTAFYRHRSSGFEILTEERYDEYRASLEADVRTQGLPPPAYIADGAPYFQKIHEGGSAMNSMLLYPGAILHSGIIRRDAPLSADPRSGRLTVNGFFRPA